MNARDDTFHSHDFGKVAPWVDLANSQEWDGFGNLSDRLDDPSWIAAFLQRWKLRPEPGERLPLAALKRLRAVLRRVTERIAAGKPLATTEAAALNSAMSVAVRQKLIQRQNAYVIELAPLHSNWNWIVAKIAAAAAGTFASEQAARIKICANHDCRWLFYDPTKARIKRWCSERTCGNRDRVRRARAAN